MKIENSPASAPLTKNSNTTFNSEDFSILLTKNNYTQSTDDYYRFHQNQFQQSALTFNRMAGKPEAIIKTESTKPENKNLSPEDNLESAPAHIKLIIKWDNYSAHNPDIIHADMQQIVAYINEKNGDPINLTTTAPINTNTLTLAKSEHKAIHHSTPIIFKNHHLFVNNNEAELTINSNGLNPDENQSLHTLIKQWLNKKGYALKQLIINGVTQ